MSKLVAFVFVVANAALIADFKLLPKVYPKLGQYKCDEAKTATEQPLLLTPLIEDGKIEEARKKSTVQFWGFLGVRSYSGFLTVDKKSNSNLFFWFFPHERKEEVPVLLWLQGGPGVSSLYGLFLENGPFKVTAHGVELRKYSWTTTHSVLYIDNPVGTGYSFTNKDGYVSDETAVGRALYEALGQFFRLFPELRKNEFYATGESYAGKYVPALAYTIMKNNPMAETQVNLQGLAIGNGYSDPINQLNYGDFLYQTGLLDRRERDQFAKVEQMIVDHIKAGRWKEAFRTFGDLIYGDRTLFKNITGFENHYNYLQIFDSNQSENDLTKFLRRCDVRRAIHVGNTTYDVDNVEVQQHLHEDVMQSVAPWISKLLSRYRILFYNGQLDIIVAYTLTENFLTNLNFSSSREFLETKKRIWRVDGDLAGYVKVAGNLTFALVRNAGHMVPTDQPKYAFDLINKFTHHEPFSS